MRDEELFYASARALRDRIVGGELSAREVMNAHLARIEAVNPALNAIVTLDPEAALEGAARADAALAGGEAPGPLHGLPVAIKDLVPTAGMRTTFGSPIYRDHVPAVDALIVERLRAAGAIVIGKTNTPEFGAGSQTFNAVFGVTANPYDPSRTCGGSSGGAAAALAAGMIPIADGSDLGGSLRNPASFCNVVGFRPSPGRIPRWPALRPWDTLGVLGPMARSVDDVALALSAMAGPDPRGPASLEAPGSAFADVAPRDLDGLRIAWSRDLGGHPVESPVIEVCETALQALEGRGARVEEAEPDLSGADEVFHVLRAHGFAAERAEDYREHRDLMKDTMRWNIEQGLALDAATVARAERRRGELYHAARTFLERFDFLALPAAPVLPFPKEIPWVREIAGVRLERYIDWMGLCSAITVTSLPAISVPAGFSPEGLPVGLQLVGPPRADRAVLEVALAFERATGHGARRPPL